MKKNNQIENETKKNKPLVEKKLMVQQSQNDINYDFKKDIYSKINSSAQWMRENPVQTVGICLAIALTARSRLVRKTLFWAVTSILTSEILKALEEKDVEIDRQPKNLIADRSQAH
jgi:hypothetical protein